MLFPNNQNEWSSAVLVMTCMCVYTHITYVYAYMQLYIYICLCYVYISICVCVCMGIRTQFWVCFYIANYIKWVFLLDCLGFISNPPFTVWTWQGVNTHYICFLLLLYHKRSGLQKTQNGSPWAKIKVLPGLHSFGMLWRKICFLAFPDSRGCLYSLDCGLLYLQSQQWPI